MRAHHIGRIVKSSNVFPSEVKADKCGNFPLGLIPLLNDLPLAYPGTYQTPVEALLHTLRLDNNPSTSPYAPKPPSVTAFERYLTQVLQFFIWSRSYPPHNQSVEQTMSWIIQNASRNAWTIPGLTQGFITPNALTSTVSRCQLGWLLASNSITDDVVETVRALDGSCRTFHRAFGARISATKLFLVQLDDENNTTRLQAQQKPPTKTLLLGLGPDSFDIGDEIWAAAGAEWPFIFHPYKRRDEDVYRDIDGVVLDLSHLVGEAYVHGTMHGELFESREPEWQEVVLD